MFFIKWKIHHTTNFNIALRSKSHNASLDIALPRVNRFFLGYNTRLQSASLCTLCHLLL
jgi:hypothetical protein